MTKHFDVEQPPFCQLDGNMSFASSESDYDDCEPIPVSPPPYRSHLDPTLSSPVPAVSNNIKVMIGNRPARAVPNQPRVPCRKTIKRDNRGKLALYLPNIAVYNHRSIWKKLNNFCLEFRELDMGVAFHSEIWEKKESKKHKHKIDEMFEMEGISYISTPRPNRRGGGSAITCDDNNFYIKEIKVPNPNNLEVTFAVLRPKVVHSPQFVIILCAVITHSRPLNLFILSLTSI